MKCLASLPEEAQSPQLVALLAKEPYAASVMESKPKGRGGLCIRDPSEAKSEDTHATSLREKGEEKEEEEEDEGKGVPSPKRKRVAFKEAEEEEHPRARRRLRKASGNQLGQRAAPAQVTLSDSSEGNLLQQHRTKLAPRRYSLTTHA